VSKGPPPVPGGRTAEEREAARLEREAKRAARRGGDTAPAPPQRPASVDGNGGVETPKQKPRPRPAPAPEPAAARPPADDWLEEARRLTTRDAAGDGRASSERPTGRVRAGRIIVALTGLALLLLAFWFVTSLFQPFKGDGRGEGDPTRVVVPRGAGVGEIGDLLEERGIVASSFFFQTRARLAGRTGDLKPGSFRLRRDMSYVAALDALEKGTPPSIVVLTIPEGRSRREVAPLVNGKLEGDYLKASRSSRALDPKQYGARNATSLEGFLFPATYELKRGRPMRALVEHQLSAFRQKFETVNMRYARSKNLTPFDVLTIASLVEREAAVAKERPLIASVIYNRLNQGIPLGIDATTRFVTGNWERPLRQSEIDNPSPYNTRANPGLPPGPIGSPGLDSIRAAARPARTGFLFYVVKPNACGEHAFSKTDAEFQRDVARYNEERAKRGGKSPTDC
jgi:UPF0755 protein